MTDETQDLVQRACDALASPDDGRDKGVGAVADLLHVDRKTVRRWRDGVTKPTWAERKMMEEIVTNE